MNAAYIEHNIGILERGS